MFDTPLEKTFFIPSDVPGESINEYLNNYEEITQGSGRVMLFAGVRSNSWIDRLLTRHRNAGGPGFGVQQVNERRKFYFKIASYGGQ